jgi:hypothetical protein
MNRVEFGILSNFSANTAVAIFRAIVHTSLICGIPYGVRPSFLPIRSNTKKYNSINLDL